MHFLSKHKRYKVSVIPEESILVTGPEGTRREITQHPFVAEFKYQALTPEEEDLARDVFTYTGTNIVPDTGTPIDPVPQRTSRFDTAWVPEKLRTKVEEILLSHPSLGSVFVRSDDKVALPQVPWPNYPDFVAGKGKSKRDIALEIVAVADSIGVDLERVKRYEVATLNRPEVLEALTQDVVEVAA